MGSVFEKAENAKGRLEQDVERVCELIQEYGLDDTRVLLALSSKLGSAANERMREIVG